MSEIYDGLILMLKFYRNHGNLSQVSKHTGVPIETLKGFLDGNIKLTPEQDKALREPLHEFGGEVKFS